MDLCRSEILNRFKNGFLTTNPNFLPLIVKFAELIPLSLATEQLYWPSLAPLTVRML